MAAIYEIKSPRGKHPLDGGEKPGGNNTPKHALVKAQSEDPLDAFPGLQRSSSCMSAVSSTIQTEAPGGLSDVAIDINTSNKSHPLTLETAGPPEDSITNMRTAGSPDTKKYASLHSVRQPPCLGLDVIQSNVKSRQRFLQSLRSKLGKKSSRSHEKTFEKICFELARADHCEIGSENAQIFELQELNLKIDLLAKSFRIVLPPYVEVAGLGDLEEQRVGGTCDQFIGSLPSSCRKVSEKASPLGLVPKLLPHGLISKEARYVGSCFWIWLCIVDDLTENLLGKEWEDTEADLFLAFSKDVDESLFNDRNSQAVRVSLALRNVIHSTNICSGVVDSIKEAPWRRSFMGAVCEVISGFREERPLLQAKKIGMYDWMKLRVITISVRPFLILARADLGLPPAVTPLGNPLDPVYLNVVATSDMTKMSNLRKVECMLQVIMGLQNDILGWEKDYKTENPLSAVQILIKHGAKTNTAMARVIDTHNELVRRCVQHADMVCDDPIEHIGFLDADGITPPMRKNPRPHVFGVFGQLREVHLHRATVPKENVSAYAQLILGFAHGMATWMAVSKRYVA